MSDPPRPPRSPGDELPEELRELIAKARPPAPLDGATRARMRRRLAAETAAHPPRRGVHRLFWFAAAAALAALLLWLARGGADRPVAVPEPDPSQSLPASRSATDQDPDGGDVDGGDADGGQSRWYPVRNRCTDAVCLHDPSCCAEDWGARCDRLLLESARLTDRFSGNVGRCYYHDRETCPSCACEYYLKVGDPRAGSVGFDGGTGCIQSKDGLLATLKRQCALAVCE